MNKSLSCLACVSALSIVAACSSTDVSQDGRISRDLVVVDRAAVCGVELTLRDDEVLSAILAHITAGPTCKGVPWNEMLLLDTISPASWTSEQQQVAASITPLSAPATAVTDLLCRNKNTVKIIAPPSSSVPRHLISPASIGDLDQLMAQYPNAGALVTLSLPGYDAVATTAVVYYSRSCGSLNAEGFYALVQRGTTGWTVAKTIPLWIA